MAYQFKREPLTADEANRLASMCNTHEEKLIIWTLLDTGLSVAELAKLKKENLDWQGHRLMVYGKGGPYGSKSKRRVIPLSPRVQPLLEGHLALHDESGIGVRTIQRTVRAIAHRASISRPVSPHVLRHTFSVGGRAEGDQPAGAAAASRPRSPGHDGDLPEPFARTRDQGIYGEVVMSGTAWHLERREQSYLFIDGG
jgi:integrase/recombinase XerD